MKALGRSLWHTATKRGLEIALLQGTPALGALLALSRLPEPGEIASVAAMLLGSVFLVAHVFALNDLADADRDFEAPSRRDSSFRRRGIPPLAMAISCASLLALGVAALAAGSLPSLPWGLGVAACGALYSGPRVYAKGVPVLSTAVHFAGQIAHFFTGYAAISPLGSRAALVAPFFGLVFAAGHLNQEVRDVDEDDDACVRTNAVVFGPGRALRASHALLACAFAALVLLAAWGVLPRTTAIVGLGYAVYAAVFIRSSSCQDSRQRARMLQAAYRPVFVAAGAVIAATWTAGRIL